MALPAMAIAGAKMAGSAVGQVGIQLALEKAFYKKDVENTTKATESAFAKSFDNVEKKSNKTFSGIGSVIKTAFTVVATGAVASFAKSVVNAASETQSAWTGLNSIVSGTGKSFSEAQGFLEEYISDGLIPLTDAITAYKNLAARGYSTEQIEGTLTALKDAAAFGRQASYSYGEAIKSATEGLKNENSILVDNAGVTKNVAKMWDDYAKSIGTTANNLTQQQKIQAEVNGIIEETKFQVGDAAAYADTFSGRIAKINTAFYNFKVAVGKFVAPIAQLFLPYIELALNALTRFFNKMAQVLKVFGLEMPDVVSKASNNIASIGTSASGTADNIASTGDAATKAAKKIKRAFAGVDEINVLNNKEESSGGSSGSIGGVGGIGDASLGSALSIGGLTDSLDGGAVKIANKIKELFAPLKDIDFTNITNAFERLKESISPLTDKLFSGLEWLWYNILVPFATWTIEDAIPSFFNALAGALDFLNGVIDYAKPYFVWLWDELLEPLAKWTGGAIVTVLDWIGKKLSIIGKWLSDNAPTIKEVKKNLEPLSNLLERLGKGLSDIVGGLFGAIDKISEGDWKGAGNSIVDGLINGISTIWNGSFVKKYIFDPIVKGFEKDKATLVGAWTTVKSWFTDIKTKVVTTMETTKEKVTKWYNTIKGWWGSKILKIGSSNSTTKNQVSGWWTTIKGWWSSKKLSIGSINSTTKTQVSNWWNSIKSWWGNKTLGLSVKMNEVTGNIKSWFNNNLIKPLNKKLPSFIPNIPYLAQGGWVQANNPRLAVIGDNKHEPEIVSPESKIKEQVIKGIKEMGGTSTNQKIDLTIKLEYPDGKYLIKEINNTQIRDGKISLLV